MASCSVGGAFAALGVGLVISVSRQIPSAPPTARLTSSTSPSLSDLKRWLFVSVLVVQSLVRGSG